jgi:N-acetylmuramoyl-L-alanine amidase
LNAAAADGKWHNATGWEAWTSKGKTESDKIAEYLYKAAEKNLKGKKLRKDTTDGDSDKESDLYVLKHTNCPAVLTENFF